MGPLAPDPQSLQLALQGVATRAGLVHAVDRAAALLLQLPGQTSHRGRLVRRSPLQGTPGALDQHRDRDVLLMNVHPDEGARLSHGPAPFFACGTGAARPKSATECGDYPPGRHHVSLRWRRYDRGPVIP